MFQLRKKFLLFGGIGFIVLAVYFITISYAHDQANLKRAGERENIILASFLSNLLETQLRQYAYLSTSSSEQLINPALNQDIEEILKNIESKYHSILKVKIFGLDGMTLYSTIPEEIGVLKQNNEPIQNARSGKATSKQELKEEFISLKGKLTNRDIVESYIPVYIDNQPVVIFELYSDITEDILETKRRLLIIQLVLLGGIAGLFIYLFLLARRADLTIRDQYDKLEEANQMLESAVSERTRDLKHALQEAEKANELKSTFLANMSHELRTPMHAILSFTDIALKKSTDEKLTRFLGNIKSAGTRLTGLLNALLDLSKLESKEVNADFQQSSLSQITINCIDELHPLSEEKSLRIEFEEGNNTTGVFDPDLIHQVIINLLSNAIKFSPEKGTVNISTSSVDKDSDAIFTGVLELQIADEGIGIPEDELNSVFDKFVQSSKTKSKAGGTGLGLSICKEIISAHNGLIWAESPATGKESGSSFHFIIPAEQINCD